MYTQHIDGLETTIYECINLLTQESLALCTELI